MDTCADQRFMSMRDAAATAGVSVQAVHQWLAAGRIECRRVGRKDWLVERASLERLLAARLQGMLAGRTRWLPRADDARPLPVLRGRARAAREHRRFPQVGNEVGEARAAS